MKAAVIGAGIVGVATAWELLSDGHEVDVFERRGSVAAEGSFANAGLVVPGAVAPWASPELPRQALRRWLAPRPPLALRRRLGPATLRWLWRWRRACRHADALARDRLHLLQLARASRERLQAIARELALDYERADGVLMLLPTRAEVALARPQLKALAEAGVRFRLVDAAQCRRIEPGLDADRPLQAGVLFAEAEVGNCRQFAHALRLAAQRRGARFHFHSDAHAIEPGASPRVSHRPIEPDDRSRLAESRLATLPAATDAFDAIVVCAGVDANALLRPHRVRLPMIALHGHSVTAPLRHFDAWPDAGPKAAVIDARNGIAIARVGERIRIAGGTQIGAVAGAIDARAVALLYRVLDDWYPGVARLDQALLWKGARAALPDGMPRIGASGLAGVWLNVGHGDHGWALACGSARRVADAIGGKGG